MHYAYIMEIRIYKGVRAYLENKMITKINRPNINAAAAPGQTVHTHTSSNPS